jgi:hypothetical protein
MAAVTVTPIGALSGDQVAAIGRIYEGAFRADQRVPFGELTVTGDADQTFAAMTGAVPAGLAAFRLLGSAGWTFLRYFAIDTGRRSTGLGREFWRLLHGALGAQGWPARIVFEVEDPAAAEGDAAESVIRQRRIKFWTGCGARLLPAPGYVTPDYTGLGTTEPMLLMAASQAAAPSLAGDRLRALVLAIYSERYGMTPDDPLVSRALASIGP